MTDFEKTAIRRVLERLRDLKIISREASDFCIQNLETAPERPDQPEKLPTEEKKRSQTACHE